LSIQYVLDNLIGIKECSECHGHWFLFNHEGNEAYYRLAPSPPDDCSICQPIDNEIESRAIITAEQWIGVE
jgi:hypothetical protein